MEEAYRKDIVVSNYSDLVEAAGMNDKVTEPTEEDLKALSSEELLGCIAWHFRRDHFDNGSLISRSIAEGHMLRMMKIYADKEEKGCWRNKYIPNAKSGLLVNGCGWHIRLGTFIGGWSKVWKGDTVTKFKMWRIQYGWRHYFVGLTCRIIMILGF